MVRRREASSGSHGSVSWFDTGRNICPFWGVGNLYQGLKKKSKVYNVVIVASAFGTIRTAHKDVSGAHRR